MTNFLVIGICIVLLLAVIYISAKPISMGIEARRDIKEKNDDDKNFDNNQKKILDENSITDELVKLNDLREKKVLTEEEYEQAKKKLLS